MKVSRLITELQISETRESRYSGVPLNDVHCPFTINVYPSDDMKNSVQTNKPAVFTVCVVIIFTFGALVFYAYDTSVERRQSLVLAAAEKTNSIVASLFPAGIRDQIMKVENGNNNGPVSTKAIADLFPDTTTFFADLSGFHEWSSSRCPRDVFELLETLYSAMDKVAKKRKVFKVETIGDCYVAVVGLPDPVPNHAVVMARFAMECVELAKLLTTQLVSSLGPDTADLQLRVGLNSGPTTAGVLRGEKARFQLFGDTGMFFNSVLVLLYLSFTLMSLCQFDSTQSTLPHGWKHLGNLVGSMLPKKLPTC
jgi:class 3 adenylate cyclase